MSQSRYDYDENSETWPYFVLTGVLLPLLPTTWSLVSENLSSGSKSSDELRSVSWFKPYNQVAQNQYRSKKRARNTLSRKFVLVLVGWVLVAAIIYQIMTTELVVGETSFDPWKILQIDESASEKVIKSAYRKLSLKFHPDKVDTSKMSQQEMDAVDTAYVLINKAYKALTDESVRENFLKYGNPDGPGEVKHGIALPKFLIEGKTSPVLVVLYVLLIAIILPTVVGSWWNGVRSYTKQGLHVDTAAHFLDVLINYNPATICQIETVLKYISSATEFQLIDKSLTPEKVESLLISHLERTHLNGKDEGLKQEIVAIAPKLIIGFIDIASSFRNTDLCLKLVETHRCIIQALNIEKDPLSYKYRQILQLPGVDLDKLDTTQPIYSLGKLLKKPTVKPEEFLNADKTDNILKIASEIPLIEPLDCKFKVTGETFVPPNANVHISLKFLVKSPAQKSKPETSKLSKEVQTTQLNEKETMETLRNPLKIVEDQPKIKLSTAPAYFPDPDYLKENNGWIAFLIVQKDGKLGENPQFVTKVDLANLKLTQEEFLESKAVVSTFKFPLTAPTPQEEGQFQFRLILRHLVYFGSDLDIPLVMEVENKPIEAAEKDLYEIEDPDEDSLAGALAQMRGESVRKIEAEYSSSDDESEEEEEEEEIDWTDIDTDTDVEEEEKKKEK
ncbi:hypothetical protein OGAPHI_003738 [Ogataea philodendri]|uniref:J domain-containing protein n=1 Tax=Ogataea philodendri TaxID=1378263 RepID=A0A9P8P5G3_9ASCO|nr:uncharacterized protein OGAPHI_003738 [Ogataea philodendri]KAH3665552.1 hypothetical protein OGAPHI_003738 [Ogataea philodendri]